MIDVVTVQGVGEHVGQEPMRMAQHVMAHLDPDHYREVPVTDYVTVGPVGINPGPSLEDSVARVKSTVLRMIADTPNLVVLVGFSGGALVAGDVADEIGRGMHPKLEVLGTGLIADPAMSRSVLGDAWGVQRSRDVNGMPVKWLYDRRDPICACPSPSSLRTFADQMVAMSLDDPYGWASDLVDRMRTARWQPSNWNIFDLVGSFRRTQRDLDLAVNYLSGLHVSAYTGEQCKNLADWIKRLT